MSLTFYTNPMSRGQIARWALHEAGVDYDEVIVAYGPPMKSSEYRAINPMGKVPSIVHDGHVVTEAAAICLYLGEAFPAAGLAPKTLAERADSLRWTFFSAGPVEQAVITNSMDWQVADDPKVHARLGFGSYDDTMNALDQLLSGRAYVCGDRFTAADVYVGAQVDWGLQFKTMPSRSSFEAYAERLRSREAYKAAKAIDAKHIAAMRAGEGG